MNVHLVDFIEFTPRVGVHPITMQHLTGSSPLYRTPCGLGIDVATAAGYVLAFRGGVWPSSVSGMLTNPCVICHVHWKDFNFAMDDARTKR